jgi:hypothetical protein
MKLTLVDRVDTERVMPGCLACLSSCRHRADILSLAHVTSRLSIYFLHFMAENAEILANKTSSIRSRVNKMEIAVGIDIGNQSIPLSLPHGFKAWLL